MPNSLARTLPYKNNRYSLRRVLDSNNNIKIITVHIWKNKLRSARSLVVENNKNIVGCEGG